jgi:hypothetical protein
MRLSAADASKAEENTCYPNGRRGDQCLCAAEERKTGPHRLKKRTGAAAITRCGTTGWQEYVRGALAWGGFLDVFIFEGMAWGEGVQCGGAAPCTAGML